MKNVRIDRKKPRRGLRIILSVLILSAALCGILAGYSRLRAIWLEQCILTDPEHQVEVITGKMVKRGQVLESFGLKAGVNLASIDFAACRAMTLRALPTIREIAFTRHLPNRLTVVVTEREPLVRLNVRGRRAPDPLGRVADTEGIVFRCFRGTETLPTLREQESPGTPPGERLSGRSLSALRLLEAASDVEFQQLGIIEVDAGYPDFILATLGDYSRAKIAWSNMADGDGGDRVDMRLRLTHLLHAVRSRLATGSVIWNATLPDRIFADTKENFL